jgi:hypothetical protein
MTQPEKTFQNLKPNSKEYLQQLHGNWEDESFYPNEKSDINQWAWELLRRNLEYQKGYHIAMSEFNELPESDKDHQYPIQAWSIFETMEELHGFFPPNATCYDSRELNPLNKFNKSDNQIELSSLKSNNSFFTKVDIKCINPRDRTFSIESFKDEDNYFIECDREFINKSTEKELKKVFIEFINSVREKAVLTEKKLRKRNYSWANALRLYDAQKMIDFELINLSLTKIFQLIFCEKSKTESDDRKKHLEKITESINNPLDIKWSMSYTPK